MKFTFRRPEALLTTPARLALGFLVLYVVGTLLIFLFLDYQLRASLLAQVDKVLLDQQSLLTLQYRDGGQSGMFRAIQSELQSRGRSDRTYRVLEGRNVIFESGELVLPNLPAGQRMRVIEASIEGNGARKVEARVLSFTIRDRFQVHIARSLESTEELMQGFRSAFILTVVLILLLGAAGAWWLTQRFWHQIQSFSQMALKIVNSGNLASRMSVRGNDEFAILASNMNAMLDKIEKLVQGIRQVSDNIAHDLRSPLTRLRADVEVTLQKKDPSKYHESLVRVLAELNKMQDIFQSLLSLGQAEAGSLKIRKKPLDFSALLSDVAELYEALAEDKGQTLVASIPPKLELQGDRQLLAQAFSNLLDNAVKYVPNDGKIMLSAERQGDVIEIRLDDSGSGIPAEHRAKVFDRFFRVDPSRTLPGTGLGLSLVKAFIEMHQGTITLTDSRLGGASFVITLPLQ